jgi:uncharacterized alkaline shock family protein YloU
MSGTVQQPDTATASAGQASDLPVRDSDTPVPGAFNVSQGVVAKVAAHAASELPEVGGASHGLGRLPGGDKLGGGGPDLGRRPKVTAHVDGAQAYLELVVSVRWPASVPSVTSALRNHVREKVQQLTGLQVGAVDIEVADLIADTVPMARVQ